MRCPHCGKPGTTIGGHTTKVSKRRIVHVQCSHCWIEFTHADFGGLDYLDNKPGRAHPVWHVPMSELMKR